MSCACVVRVWCVCARCVCMCGACVCGACVCARLQPYVVGPYAQTLPYDDAKFVPHVNRELPVRWKLHADDVVASVCTVRGRLVRCFVCSAAVVARCVTRRVAGPRCRCRCRSRGWRRRWQRHRSSGRPNRELAPRCTSAFRCAITGSESDVLQRRHGLCCVPRRSAGASARF